MRIQLKQNSLTIEDYLNDCCMRGLSGKTIETYRQHLYRCYELGNTPTEIYLKLYKMKPSTKNSYLRTLKTYLNWKGEEVPFKIKNVQDGKPTYTDEELRKLLRKPNNNNFCENRNWLIEMVMCDTGIRSSSIRDIKTNDVDFTQNILVINNKKSGIRQVVPFSQTVAIHLKTFINNKEFTEYLFCNEFGGQLSANGLKLAIRKYNLSRGVNKTSAHMFRHTFAKKYLIECGGNAFTLQKMLGHSSLNITKQYCQLYDKDIIEGYISPVETVIRSKIKYRG